MKSKLLILLPLLLVFSVHQLPAQQEITVIDSTAIGTIKFALVNSNSKLAKQETTKAFLKRILNAGKGTEFYLYRIVTDELGMVHEKYQQTFNGLKVEFSEFIVHKDKSGNIVSINGNFAHVPESFSIKPKLEFNDAVNRAALAQKQVIYNVSDLPEERSVESPLTKRVDKYEVVLVRGYDDRLHLAYKANLTGERILDSYYGYISCETGDMVFTQPLVYATNVPGIATTKYSGNQTITTDSYSGGYRLRETSRGGTTTAIQTLNFNRAPAAYVSDIDNGIATATDFSDNDNNWTTAEYNNVNKDNAAFDAHWGSEKTFDYLKTIHSRNSYDGNNGLIISYVHVKTRDNNGNSIPMDNAFWLDSKKALFFGDGQYFSPLVSLDIIAHEIGHGVCNSSVSNGTGLTYSKESGALNESLSDIWGACVEQWSTTDKQTWIIGENVTWGGIRSMINPELFDQPNTYQSSIYWVNTDGCSPNNNNDHCGVHTNSGVGNYWFYLLSQGGSGTNDNGNSYSVTGIGITNAARIVYRMENYYLSANSGYTDARNASIQASINLFGANSCQTMAVTNAWYAVGVGSSFQLTGVSVTNPTLVCSSGATFSVSNLPSGASVSWSTSSNLAQSSSSGSSAAFIATGNGIGTVTATVDLGCGSVTLASKTVWVGKPSMPYTAPNRGVDMAVNEEIKISLTSTPGSTASTGYWWATGVLYPSTSQYGNSCFFDATSTGHGSVYVTTTNQCGTSATFQIPILVQETGGGTYTISPNPASSEVTVDIVKNSSNTRQTTSNTVDEPVSIRSIKVFDQQGNMVISESYKNSSNAVLSVSSLRKGIYIVLINDSEKHTMIKE